MLIMNQFTVQYIVLHLSIVNQLNYTLRIKKRQSLEDYVNKRGLTQ